MVYIHSRYHAHSWWGCSLTPFKSRFYASALVTTAVIVIEICTYTLCSNPSIPVSCSITTPIVWSLHLHPATFSTLHLDIPMGLYYSFLNHSRCPFGKFRNLTFEPFGGRPAIAEVATKARRGQQRISWPMLITISSQRQKPKTLEK